ncbi:kinase-like domain-containing protein [Aspergillus floccosus]
MAGPGGGYHPFPLHNLYRIVHKLGHGSYSTIWLLRQGYDPYNLSFRIQGPYGTHACNVTSPARMSFSDATEGSYVRLFRLEVARALAAHLAIAVEYIHAQRFVHGDLHCGNILLCLPLRIDRFSDEELYQKYGGPQSEAIQRFDGKKLPPCIPSHGILPIWLGKASESLGLPESKALLSDFGEACSPIKEDRQPLSFPSDIWSIVCTIWAIIAQRPLFEGFLASEDDMTCEHVDVLGILPPEWWTKWDARGNKFSDNGTPINRDSYRSLKDRFEDSRDALFSMLKLMLSFGPENRPSAKDMLASEWITK